MARCFWRIVLNLEKKQRNSYLCSSFYNIKILASSQSSCKTMSILWIILIQIKSDITICGKEKSIRFIGNKHNINIKIMLTCVKVYKIIKHLNGHFEWYGQFHFGEQKKIIYANLLPKTN